MGKAILGIIIVVLAICLLMLIRGYLRNRTLKIVQQASKKITDTALEKSLINLKSTTFAPQLFLDEMQSEYIADVWGRGVLAFEYSIPTKNLTTDQLPLIKEKLSEQLKLVAKQSNLEGWQGHLAFYISDIWLFAEVLHVDIAYLANQQTLDYLHDIQQLEK